jgi:HK97 family phage major capsid protein
MTMLDQRNQRNQAAAAMRSILETAGADGLTGEQEAAFDKAAADFDRLDATLTRSAKVEALHLPEPAGIGTGTGTAPVEPSAEVRAFDAFVRFGVTGAGLVRATDLETRAQGVATGAAGGFLVPADFRAGIIKAQKAFGGLQNLVQVINTDSGAALTYPTVDDTGNVGALIGENTAVTEQDVAVGNKSLKAHKWTSKLVRVSNELLQDDTYNLETELGSLLGERIGRAQSPFLITGTGVNEPEGILTNKAASVTTVAGATTSLGSSAQAQDLLIDLETALEESYLPNAGYVMRRTTLAVVRKIRDADGRPIWQPSLTAGIPATINGYSVVTDPAMPAMAAGAKSIVFGDLRQAYVWRNVNGIAVRRLNERYAEFDQVGFLGFARADGQVQNAGAYVVAANAAA